VRRLLILGLAATMAVLSVAVLPASGSPKAGFELPPEASEVAQGVFFLGSAVHDGVVVDGYAIAVGDPRARREDAKPPGAGGGRGGGGSDPAADCYSFIANGAKWVDTEGFEVEVAGSDDLDLTGVIGGAFQAWEDAAGNNMVDDDLQPPSGKEFLADSSSPDDRNEVYADSISDPGVLGYTIVWSTRKRGRTPGEIIEADMVIDTDFNWSENGKRVWTGAGDDEPFDLATVVTHEAGHWVGMGHAPTTSTCAKQLMYPSVAPRDIKLLGVGDTAGIKALY
jgi:hypothetical protein